MKFSVFAGFVSCLTAAISMTAQAEVSTSHTQFAQSAPLELEYYATGTDLSQLVHHAVYLARASYTMPLELGNAIHVYKFEGKGRVETSFTMDSLTDVEFALIKFIPDVGQPTELKLDIRPFVFQDCTRAADGRLLCIEAINGILAGRVDVKNGYTINLYSGQVCTINGETAGPNDPFQIKIRPSFGLNYLKKVSARSIDSIRYDVVSGDFIVKSTGTLVSTGTSSTSWRIEPNQIETHIGASDVEYPATCVPTIENGNGQG